MQTKQNACSRVSSERDLLSRTAAMKPRVSCAVTNADDATKNMHGSSSCDSKDGLKVKRAECFDGGVRRTEERKADNYVHTYSVQYVVCMYVCTVHTLAVAQVPEATD